MKWGLATDNVFRLLWKNLTKLGTGTAFGSNKMYCIAQYSPAVDKWRLKGNVLPPLKKTSTPRNSNLTKISDRWYDPLFFINDDCHLEFKKSHLERHNYYRSLHGLQPVTEDPELSKTTQLFLADEIAKKSKYFDKHKNSENHDDFQLGCSMFNHDVTLKMCYGINMFFLLLFKTLVANLEFFLQKEFGLYCVDNWYKETQNLNFDKPEYRCENDSAVRLLWKNTTKIGMAFGKRGSLWCVTRYYPPPPNIWDLKGNIVPPLNRTLIYN